MEMPIMLAKYSTNKVIVSETICEQRKREINIIYSKQTHTYTNYK